MICSDAAEMLKYRRHIAANKNLSTDVIKSMMDCIDLIRWNHEETTDPNCDCWQKARRDADRKAA